MIRSIPPAVMTVVLMLAAASSTAAQDRLRPRAPVFESPEVTPERLIVFRLYAPNATAVSLDSDDLPGFELPVDMEPAGNGIWTTAVGPVPSGAYRYHFNVDGISVIDPRNPDTSEASARTWSLVYVSGSEFCDLTDVPHGAIALVNYYSRTLQQFRRMHVYTPPGYESGDGSYPTLYLLHGAFDCDAAWSTVGRAGMILDNLIAAGAAKPMIVVMPDGHTGRSLFGPQGRSFARQFEEFADDFQQDLKPYVERNYRVLADRDHRAIAGLSMGGMQTLNIAFSHLDEFGYVGVFSSGVFGVAGGPDGSPPGLSWEQRHRVALTDSELKDGVRLLWFATGEDDFNLQTTQSTVAMLESYGFDVVYRRTAGGHTWINWRQYLSEFAPLLFDAD